MSVFVYFEVADVDFDFGNSYLHCRLKQWKVYLAMLSPSLFPLNAINSLKKVGSL